LFENFYHGHFTVRLVTIGPLVEFLGIERFDAAVKYFTHEHFYFLLWCRVNFP